MLLWMITALGDVVGYHLGFQNIDAHVHMYMFVCFSAVDVFCTVMSKALTFSTWRTHIYITHCCGAYYCCFDFQLLSALLSSECSLFAGNNKNANRN